MPPSSGGRSSWNLAPWGGSTQACVFWFYWVAWRGGMVEAQPAPHVLWLKRHFFSAPGIPADVRLGLFNSTFHLRKQKECSGILEKALKVQEWRSTAALPRHGKGIMGWGKERKGSWKDLGSICEMSSKELVKTRFFSTGHGVLLEGSMSYAKGRSWALLMSIYKWRRRSCGDSWSIQSYIRLFENENWTCEKVDIDPGGGKGRKDSIQP